MESFVGCSWLLVNGQSASCKLWRTDWLLWMPGDIVITVGRPERSELGGRRRSSSCRFPLPPSRNDSSISTEGSIPRPSIHVDGMYFEVADSDERGGTS